MDATPAPLDANIPTAEAAEAADVTEAVVAATDAADAADAADATWCAIPRPLGAKLLITDACARAPTPAKLATPLLAHQQTTLAAMLDYEQNRRIDLDGVECPPGYIPLYPCDGAVPAGSWLSSNSACLAEPFGSGKTLIIAALIASRPVPLARAPVQSLYLQAARPNYEAKRRDAANAFVEYGGIPASVVPSTVKFPGRCDAAQWRMPATLIERRQPRLLRTTLLLVSRAAFSQFVAEFTRHAPAITKRTIANSRELESFRDDLARPDYCPPDAIIAKSGVITENFQTHWERARDYRRYEKRGMASALAAVLRGYTLARFVVDDFDHIGFRDTWVAPDAYFTWYVSATNKPRSEPGAWEKTEASLTRGILRPKAAGASRIQPESSPYAYLEAHHPRLVDAARDGLFALGPTFASAPEYVTRAMQLPRVQFRKYNLVNPVQRAVQIIGALGGVGDNVMEMLNGDAVGAAAEATLNYRVDSIGDLMGRLLDDRAAAYRQALRAVGRVMDVRRAAAAARREKRAPQTGASVHVVSPAGLPRVVKIGAAIKQGSDALMKLLLAHIGAPHPALNTLLSQTKKWAEATRDEAGRDLERIRDNVRSGACPACLREMAAGFDSVILKCCGVVLCVGCAAPNARHAGGRGRIIRQCPNCRAPTARAGFIVVRSDVPLDSLLDDSSLEREAAALAATDDDAAVAAVDDAAVAAVGDPVAANGDPTAVDAANGDPAAAEAAAAAAAEAATYAGIDNPKLRVLARIIDGATAGAPAEAERGVDIEHSIPKLVVGRERVPLPPGAPRSVLVYANERETILRITAMLTARDVEHAVIKGSVTEINEMALAYQEGRPLPGRLEPLRVLVAQSEKHCASLNLQTTTDLVFYHKICNESVEAQLCGRGQRLGRASSLTVHYLLYPATENVAGVQR